jgi:hypothetical protein
LEFKSTSEKKLILGTVTIANDTEKIDLANLQFKKKYGAHYTN